MTPRADFAVYSPDQQLQLVVEVKGVPKSDPGWAAKLRRNLIAHGAVPHAPYFLLVLPDYFYLWSPSTGHEAALPDFSAETKRVLHRYLSHWRESEQGAPISERGLELAVRSWLSDLTERLSDVDLQGQEGEWLRKSGLAAKLRTGTVRAEGAR